mmetsp:Transcript_141650/g.394910  ORF Transcript_141650/g.394910 Transcript_141650/m.394910 type:complete len:206 (-) Transcript_141650:1516-2133(-)
MADLRHHLAVKFAEPLQEGVIREYWRVELEVHLRSEGFGDELQELHVCLVEEMLLLLQAVLRISLNPQSEISGDAVLGQVTPQCVDLLLNRTRQNVETGQGRSQAGHHSRGDGKCPERHHNGENPLLNRVGHDLFGPQAGELRKRPMEREGVPMAEIVSVVDARAVHPRVLASSAQPIPHACHHVGKPKDQDDNLGNVGNEDQLF